MPPGRPLPPAGPPGRGPRAVTRRTVLRTGALAGSAALTGCGLLGGGPGGPATPAGPPPGTDELIEALRAEEALLAAHRATAEQHPGLRDRLDGARADHEEHRGVLLALLADLDPSGPWAGEDGQDGPAGQDRDAGRSGTPAPLPESASPAAATGPSPGVPADPDLALAALRTLEQDAASARAEQAVRVDSRWAPLLGVLAASEASHAAVLAA